MNALKLSIHLRSYMISNDITPLGVKIKSRYHDLIEGMIMI